MVYKRVNKTLKQNIEHIASNNQGIYLNTSITGANFAPYHGIYINQSVKSDEIYVSKMIEKIFIGTEQFNIMDIKTSENEYGGMEYLESFTNETVPTYVYNIHGCIIEKKYKLHPEDKVLCVEYKVSNATGKHVKIITSPCITRRNLFVTKRKSDMKFTSYVTPNATKVALSISENLNLYVKSPNMKYNKKEGYITGINYDFEDELGNIKTYVEDLFVPGSFEGAVKNNNTNTFAVVISTKDIEVKKTMSSDMEQDILARDNMRYGKIDKNYYELLELAKMAYNLQYIDKEKKQLVLLESMPVVYNSDDYIKNVISSIEGNYLLLKRFKEAYKILESMMMKLKDTTYKLNSYDRCESMLLFIEALNRYLMESEAPAEQIEEFYKYIKQNIYEYLDKKYKDIYADEKMILVVNDKRYIKLNALWYNALRIFVDLADKFHEESEFIYTISETLRENIINVFWDEEKNVLKYEVEETAYATVDMLYALSLSYPVLKDNNMSMKLMDTAFKKLYTALGMRLAEIKSEKYDGYLYPHLMVHFLKANLRQMGVTRASQKLAYNLIKELFAQIGKDTVQTINYRYNEKTKKGYGISAITNAEIIRAFDMLT